MYRAAHRARTENVMDDCEKNIPLIIVVYYFQVIRDRRVCCLNDELGTGRSALNPEIP